MNEDTLGALERGWLALEGRDTPLHMGVLLYLRPVGEVDEAALSLARQWQQALPVAPWTWRIERRLGRTPRYAVDGRIDIEYHFRVSALPRPGGERELGELVSRLHGKRLELDRPAWEVHLIEGLRSGPHAGCLAIYLKLHPALLSAGDLRELLPRAFGGAHGQAGRAPWELALPRRGRGRPGRGPLALIGPLQRRLREALLSRLPWAGLRRAPASPLNARINSLRRFATQHYDRARLARVGARIQASEEELLIYLCGSALRRFFREYNALPDAPLLALVGDRSRSDGQLSPLFVSLGTQHAHRRKRLDEIRESLRVARVMVRARGAHSAAVEASVEALPYVLRQLSGLDHRLAPMFNLALAHYELPAGALRVGPHPIEEIYPMPMLLQGAALAMASAGYGDTVGVGLCGARDNLPHLQRIAVYMERALRELEEEGLDNA